MVRRWGVPFLLLVFLGCGGRASWSAEDLKKVEAAVRTSLESWKNAESADKLRKLSPPIEINDFEWKAGAKLLSFEITKTEGALGDNARCWVKLSVQPRQGKKLDREVVFEVNTSDKIVIGRDPMN